MESNFKENSSERWLTSGFIALLLLFGLMLLIREDKKFTLFDGPAMELDYVVVENNEIKEPETVQRVKPREVEEKVQEVVPEEKPVDIITTSEILIEPSSVSQPDITSGSTKPVEQPQSSTSTSTGSAPQRIGSATELDNTEFSPIFNPKPDYPSVAQASNISGFVDVDLIINEQGKVESFTIVETRGHPLFAVETAKVLPRWKFPPPRISGKKVRVKYVYRINFTLN